MKVCQKCGAMNPDDNRFCTNCGHDMDSDGAVINNQYEMPPQPVQPVKQSSNIIPILIAVVVSVAIIVAGAVIISMNKNKNSEPVVMPTTAVQTTQPTTQPTTEAPTTTTTAPPTTEAPKAQSSGDVKVYIYDGYSGGSSRGYEIVHSDGYLFPSDSEYLTDSYLSSLTRDQIALIRNEIYARHGYIFKKSQFRNYFNSMDWYYGYESDMSTVEKSFNYVEKENIKTLVRYEKAMGWR